MSSRLFQYVVVLVAGIIVGIISVRDDVEKNHDTGIQDVTGAQDDIASVSAEQQVQRLEQEIARLKAYIANLEEATDNDSPAQDDNTATGNSEDIQEEKLTIENLVAAGVSEIIAEDIINRKSQHEYQLLELSDRAIREGYMKTPRYFQEYRKLAEQDISLRDEIGVDAYDRYLYATAQNNRVSVRSIMNESPAEQLGIQQGDILISYADKKILEWRDIRKATAEGVYGEYVGITLLRENRLINILVPRGPLGVKLSPVKLDPDVIYGY